MRWDIDQLYRRALAFCNLPAVAAAALWRRCLPGTTVVAIAGSMGKSTAANCLFQILSARFSTITNGDSNGRFALTWTLLRLRRRHRFAVMEVGIIKKGRMWRSAWMIKPNVVVMTGVARRHMASFQDLDTVLNEKAKIMRYLKPQGLAVLNGDDLRVASLADRLPCHVVWFGGSPKFDIWAEEVRGIWPERMKMRVHAGHESYDLQTRLVGTHWAPSVLAAIATAIGLGVTAGQAVEALQGVEPFQARLEPRALPNGAMLLRDEYNGGLPTYRVALGILREARVRRRVAVIGQATEAEGGPSEASRILGELVAASCDTALLIGKQALATRAAALTAGMPPDRLHTAADVTEGAAWLGQNTGEGDLVLLKGEWMDHLSRIFHAQIGKIACWKTHCSVPYLCDKCSELGLKVGPVGSGVVANRG
jgi:UDP-N-acetylmuramoyl-tripeptide--D-alanyl-D-alanine ligase